MTYAQVRPLRSVGRPAFAQERIWFLEQLNPGTSAYVLQHAVRLRGPLDAEALRSAVEALPARHDSLRMCFPVSGDGRPGLVVEALAGLPLTVVDAEGVAEARRLASAQVARPFDLARPPLARALLVRLTGEAHEPGADHVLVLTVHHIVSDGWSMARLVDDVAALYAAASAGGLASAPAAPPAAYLDFAARQRERPPGPDDDAHLAYWRRALDGVPPLDLPTDRPRPAEQGVRGASHTFRLEPDLVSAVSAVSRRCRATPYMTFLAALQVVLHRCTGQSDFAIGSPVAGRPHPDLESVVGLFVNTVALRADLSGDPGFGDLLRRTRSTVIEALTHQDVPFEQVIQELDLPRDVARPVVFQVLFALQNYGGEFGDWPGLTSEWFAFEESSARFELSLFLSPVDGGLNGSLVYNTDLFDAATAARLAGHYETLLRSVAEAPDAPISALDLLTADERARLLDRSAGPALTPHPAARTLDGVLAPAVAATPDAPAVVCDGATLTYRELDRRAGRLARQLRRHGVGPDRRVGVCLEPSTTLAVALLAVLRAGGAYVPLDPEQPAARTAHMLASARPGLILTSPGLRAGIEAAGGGAAVRLLDPEGLLEGDAVDEGDQVDEGVDGGPPDRGAGPDDLAYVIYTSGSTGTPKGVAVAHRQVLNYLDGVAERLEVVPGSRYALLQSLSFDFSVTVFYLALATGGCVHLLPRRSTGPELAELLRAHRIDYLKITPTHLAALAAEVPDGALLPALGLILGGEASALRWAAGLARGPARVVNHYGPTEATVGVTTFEVDPDDPGAAGGRTTPIGRPLPGARAYVLDGGLRLVPEGVPGELHLGGDRLARGYLGLPGPTADRFVPDPYGPPGSRMYRTGDRARWLPDGSLEFLGRTDHQVKLRGFRIEPGEIEAVLARCPGVAQAVVVLRDERLVAYLQRSPGGDDVPVAELRRFAAGQLPDYMVPGRWVWLDVLPLQEHGKIDRRALPDPGDAVQTAGPVEPEGPIETAVAAVWAGVLGVERVGATDDFFDIGGHSLLATQVAARLRRALPDGARPVSVMDLFKHRTVRALGELIGGSPGGSPEGGATAAATAEGLLHELTAPVPPGATVRSFVCVPYGGASAVVYQPLADVLPPGNSLYAVAVPGHDVGRQERPEPLEETARRCVEEILARIAGPLVVYGHCGPGSALAVEIARRLEAAGRELDAVYVGGAFPFARPAGGPLGRLFGLRLGERLRGDRVYANWLRSMGAEVGALDEESLTFMIRSMREDARAAEEYFTAMVERGAEPLRAPVVSVIGERDPGTEYYQERYREWHAVSGTAALVVLDEAGHYFLKFRAGELADVLTGVDRRLDEPVPPVDPERSWWLTGISRQGSSPASPASPDAADNPGGPAAVPDGPRPSMARFLTVAAGQLVSMTGTAITEFAVPLWIYLTTGSLVRFALFTVLGMLPGLLISPVAGVIVDRADRRAVMLAGDLAALAGQVVLGVLWWTGELAVWHVYGVVSWLSVALAFQRLAYTSAVPQLVPKHYLGHANGVVQAALGVAQTLVPLIAVGVYATIGLGGIILFDVASYTFAVVVLLFVRFPRSMAWRRRESFGAELSGGVRYSLRHRHFRAMLGFFAAFNVFLSPLFLLLSPLVLATSTLSDVARVALLGGLGTLAGGLVMSVWGGPRRRRLRGVLAGALGFAAACAVTGSHPALAVVAAGAFGMSFALTMINGVYLTIVQTKVPQRLHGRVIALNTMVAWSTLPVGWAVLAPLGTAWAEPLMMPGGALAPTVGALIGTGPGRGIGLLYLLFALAIAGVVGLALRTGPLARFDEEVPDAPPDDLVGLRALQERGRL